MKYKKQAETDLSTCDSIGNWCHDLARELWPINRSLTGEGVRQTLAILKSKLPNLELQQVDTGYHAFDWEVPQEWAITEAYLLNEQGNRVLDFSNNNLHVVGYSEPVDRVLSLQELQDHLYSLPDQPDAIPYVTSYYKKRWGFCLSHRQRLAMKEGNYRAVIKSKLFDGVLNYGELTVPGKSSREIFLSTYICHPSMANNELSGPVVTAALARWIESIEERKYTYRIVFIPETLGSLVYLSQNFQSMKSNVFAGFNVTCIGDERCYSYLPSRHGNTVSDIVAKHVLKFTDPEFKSYSWLDRGSDERQYCAPGVDLPIATIMRSKYGEYPEYHTSLDDLDNVVTPNGLLGGFSALQRAIRILETDNFPCVTVNGEPQLGKRGLYPTLSQKGSGNQVRDMMNMISYCDGSRSMLEIADMINVSHWELTSMMKPLIENGLIEVSEQVISI